MFDIITVGAGPAGIAAAIYACRAGRRVLMLEREVFGGQITYSPSVENYPGYKQISGGELADSMLSQAMELGAECEPENVTGISRDGSTFKVACESGSVYTCRAVIIATGSRHRHLGIPREDELTGKGVSYCAVCDGAFFRDKTVCVVGGGDSALQDALYLSERSKKVYLIHRRTGFRAENSLVEKVRARDNIVLLLEYTVSALLGERNLTGVRLASTAGKPEVTVETDGLFIAVGQIPQNEPFRDNIAIDRDGYADSGEDCKTTDSGIFVAGDCRRKSVRQLTTAVGDGAVAAIAACEYLESIE